MQRKSILARFFQGRDDLLMIYIYLCSLLQTPTSCSQCPSACHCTLGLICMPKSSTMYTLTYYYAIDIILSWRVLCVWYFHTCEKREVYYLFVVRKEGSYPYKIGTFRKMLRYHRYFEAR